MSSSDDVPGLGLLAVTSPDLLHRGWTAAQAARWSGEREPSHVEHLLSRLAPGAGLVTIADAAPASLSWLGGVLGQRVAPLGVEKFGQTGSLADLYAAYRLDGSAITEGVAELLLPANREAAWPGRYFDEWQVGDKVAHAVTRTVTETDNMLISALTHNPQPMHLDLEAAAAIASSASRSSTRSSPSA